MPLTSRQVVRSLLAAVLVAAIAVLPGVSAQAAPITPSTPPSEFGADWDNPRTAAPAVPVPTTRRCSVEVVSHGFANYDVYANHYAPPTGCGGDWSKVVMRLDGSVKGRQYDRLGWLDVGGVRMLTLSTPEPSAEGISWHVEKDVTNLSPVLRSAQDVAMYVGNTVDDTYTGIFDITVTLDFYTTGRDARPADTADQVLPLSGAARDGSDLVGQLTVPRNTTRLVADVFATGSGGGCEEFWDTSAPASTGYSCSDGLPYREVDVSIDGRVAGIAAPYPVIYTGGWSNPFLWYTVPSPNAFDIPPLRYDLTPFAATLNDGRPHEVRLSVVGLPAGQDGWTLAPRFSVWRDARRPVVTGAMTRYAVSAPAIESSVTGADDHAGAVTLHGTRQLTASGYLDTSAGRIATTIDRRLRHDSTHTWTDAEADDVLDATWRDTSSVTTATGRGRPSTNTEDLRYAKKGTLSFHPHPGIDGASDVTGDLSITYAQHSTATRAGRTVLDRDMADTYTGQAFWIYGVPREERHATATTSERYVLTGDPEVRRFDHELTSVNGTFTVDRTRH